MNDSNVTLATAIDIDSTADFAILGIDFFETEFVDLFARESPEKQKLRSQRVENRDRLLGFLQLHRLKFNELVERTESPSDLRAALFTEFSEQSVNDRAFRILLHHPNELWNFLKSDRYNGDPIALASAMASAPEGKSPRTSLDYFLAKRNQENFKGVHFGAVQEREDRILASKMRLRGNRAGLWVGIRSRQK